MRRDFRVLAGGKLSHDDALALALGDGEPWRTVRAIQIGHQRNRTVREWEHTLDQQFDAILSHADRGDWEAVRDWLRQVAGTAMAWHEVLEDRGGAA